MIRELKRISKTHPDIFSGDEIKGQMTKLRTLFISKKSVTDDCSSRAASKQGEEQAKDGGGGQDDKHLKDSVHDPEVECLKFSTQTGVIGVGSKVGVMWKEESHLQQGIVVQMCVLKGYQVKYDADSQVFWENPKDVVLVNNTVQYNHGRKICETVSEADMPSKKKRRHATAQWEKEETWEAGFEMLRKYKTMHRHSACPSTSSKHWGNCKKQR